MAAPNTPSANLLSLLHRSFPEVIPSLSTDADLPSFTTQIYPSTSYTDNEKVEIQQWLTTSSRLSTTTTEDDAKHTERLSSLNTHLSTRTTLLGSKPSIADIAIYSALAPQVEKWSAEERTGELGYRHVVRYVDFVQNAPVFGLQIPEEEKVPVDVDEVVFKPKPVDPKEEKERKKKEKAAAAAAAAATTAGGAGAEAAASTPAAAPAAAGEQKDLPDRTAEEAPKSRREKAKEKATDLASSAKAAVTGEQPTQKREKKQKQPKAAPAAAAPKALSPALIDLRVGHILKCVPHPDADSLFVSTISCGDAPGADSTSTYDADGTIPSTVVRTVCSGLNGLVPIAEMQGRKVIVVCNLKPVKMRGIVSAAMVLAASPRLKEGEEDSHKGPVELVSPPEGAEAGERVFFEGFEGEPEGVLNPKKKVWEMCQVGFTTTGSREVAFEADKVEQLGEEGMAKGTGRLVTKTGGVCTVRSLEGATVR